MTVANICNLGALKIDKTTSGIWMTDMSNSRVMEMFLLFGPKECFVVCVIFISTINQSLQIDEIIEIVNASCFYKSFFTHLRE